MGTCQNDLEPLRFGVIFLMIYHGDFVVGFDGICIILKHPYRKQKVHIYIKIHYIYICVCVTATSSIYVQMMLHVVSGNLPRCAVGKYE